MVRIQDRCASNIWCLQDIVSYLRPKYLSTFFTREDLIYIDILFNVVDGVGIVSESDNITNKISQTRIPHEELNWTGTIKGQVRDFISTHVNPEADDKLVLPVQDIIKALNAIKAHSLDVHFTCHASDWVAKHYHPTVRFLQQHKLFAIQWTGEGVNRNFGLRDVSSNLLKLQMSLPFVPEAMCQRIIHNRLTDLDVKKLFLFSQSKLHGDDIQVLVTKLDTQKKIGDDTAYDKELELFYDDHVGKLNEEELDSRIEKIQLEKEEVNRYIDPMLVQERLWAKEGKSTTA